MLNSVIVLWDCMKTYEDNILTFIHKLFTGDKNQWMQSFSAVPHLTNGDHQGLLLLSDGVRNPAILASVGINPPPWRGD